MIEKLRIAVVVRNMTGWKIGSIIFQDSEDDINTDGYYGNINLSGDYWYHNESQLMSCVIDTRSAKGDATLGAFLCMVWHYRISTRKSGLDWSAKKAQGDSAYLALEKLHKHGPDDSITIKINDADCTISRVSAKEILKALEQELKGE